LKLSSFFKMKHKICKESIQFYKFRFIEKWLRKNVIYWKNSNNFSWQVAEKKFKKSFVWKSHFGGKRQIIIIYGNICGSFEYVLTHAPFMIGVHCMSHHTNITMTIQTILKVNIVKKIINVVHRLYAYLLFSQSKENSKVCWIC